METIDRMIRAFFSTVWGWLGFMAGGMMAVPTIYATYAAGHGDPVPAGWTWAATELIGTVAFIIVMVRMWYREHERANRETERAVDLVAHYEAKPRSRYFIACEFLESVGPLVQRGIEVSSVQDQSMWYAHAASWWSDVNARLLPLMDRHEALEWRTVWYGTDAWEPSSLTADVDVFRLHTSRSRQALNAVRGLIKAFANRESVPAKWMNQHE